MTYLQAYDLGGRAAVVTGGGTHLGAAIAGMLAAAGADLVLVGRRPEVLEARAAAIVAETGRRCIVARADLTRSAEAQAAVDTAVGSLGRLDILVNNAGWSPFAYAKDVDDDLLNDVMAINLNAAFYTSRAAYPHLKRAGRGAIVNISSLAAQLISVKGAPYAASKAAVQSLTRSCAIEWGADGIRVNSVSPGYIPSDDIRDHLARSGIDPDQGGRVFALGRTGRPDEIAHAVLFLASDAASYISGEVLTVSGGPFVHGSSRLAAAASLRRRGLALTPGPAVVARSTAIAARSAPDPPGCTPDRRPGR